MAVDGRIGAFIRINRWLLVSLIALGFAAYFSLQYVHKLQQVHGAKASVIPMSTVVVARSVIQAMTPITANELTTESLPAASIPLGAYTTPTALAGAWSAEVVSPGIPVVASETFIPKSANIIAARIARGDMATDVPLGASNAVDGLIQPGDSVSLFTTITQSSGKSVVEDFLNRVPVLAVNGVLTPSTTSTPGQGETLILALNPAQIATLIYVQEKGTVTAVLDAPVGTTPVPLPYGVTQWETPIP